MQIHLLEFRIGQKQLVLWNGGAGDGAVLDDAKERILDGCVECGTHGKILGIEPVQIRAVSVEQFPSLSSRISKFDHGRVVELVLKVDTVALNVGGGMRALKCAHGLSHESRQSLRT